MKIKTYQKVNSLNFSQLIKESLSDVYNSRFLAKQLAIRDISSQYRQSFLGIIWAFIAPLTTAFVWIFLNRTGTISLTETGVAYPVYAFTGTLIWSIVAEAIMIPITSTNSSRNILTKINFPKEALIFSGVYKMLFNSFIKIILVFVFVFIYGVGFHLSQLLFPLAIFVALLVGLTIGLLITPIGLLYKDVGKSISFAMGFLMYVTPVVYAVPKEGIMKVIMELNPLTPIILTARDSVLSTTPEYLYYYFGLILVSLPLFLVALVIYRISIPIIVERLSA